MSTNIKRTCLLIVLVGTTGLLLLWLTSSALAQTQRTNYVVDSAADGVAEASNTPDGNLTLREAIIAANTDEAYGDAPAGSPAGDTITFAPTLDGQTITLQQGELTVTDTLTIDGGGTISVSGGNMSRVFNVTDGIVTFSGLTIQDGNLTLSNNGGGLFVDSLASVTLTGTNVTGNVVENFGGGIYVLGTLLVTDTIIANNDAFEGGGLYCIDGSFVSLFRTTVDGNSALNSGGLSVGAACTTMIEQSTLSNNTAGGDGGDGGGIGVNNGVLSLSHTSVISNQADVSGGGLSAGSGTVNIINTTFSNNEADVANTNEGSGGGIDNLGATIVISNTTIVSNTAASGGGISTIGSAGNTTIGAGLVVQNSGSPNADVEQFGGGSGYISTGYNVIGVGFTTAFTNTGDISGVVSIQTAPLADNGGPTLTHALLTTSEARDRIPLIPRLVQCPVTDQRRVDRPIGSGCDSGAFEGDVEQLAVGLRAISAENPSRLLLIFAGLLALLTYGSSHRLGGLSRHLNQ